MNFRLLLASWLLCCPRLAEAHFIWLKTSGTDSAKVHVYFGESAEPDDPALLGKIATAEAWAFGGRGEPKSLTLTAKSDALEAPLTAEQRHATIALRQTYGVIEKGGESFLLKYYAKTYPSPLAGSWKSVGDQERLPLEVTPEYHGKQLKLKVNFQGKPVDKSQVVIVGPGIKEKIEGVTDDAGVFTCEISQAGTFSIRAKHVEATAGKHLDREYKSVRHYSTLTLPFVPVKITPTMHQLPSLPKGTTSFGGAISGDMLFVYGGNYGSAHEYANEDQSGDLWKLNLQQPGSWEKVSSSSKLQGLAMVEYRGQVIRIGGFTALNKTGEKEDLRSQAEVACLNADGTWEALPSLPAPRSSHDAAVVGDTIYVVGGWNMQGAGKNAVWHNTTLALRLNEEKLSWKEVAAAPFKRRALALAAWQGKLVCIGGMQEQRGPTTAVAIYDPSSDKWTDGPSLQGTGMEGFGASAFAIQDALFVSTISGSIQRLSSSEKGWEYVGQISHPRFFHRLLPWQKDKLVIVGGSDMISGKVEALEILPVGELTTAAK